MANVADFKGDISVLGQATVNTINLRTASIRDADVISAANIAYSKLTPLQPVRYYQANGSDVASATQTVHFARSAGEIVAVEVRPETAPTGGDKQFTVDVKKASNGSTSFSSVLSATVDIDSSSVDGTLETGTVNTTTYADGDALQIVITASGSTGSQGQGVCVVVWIAEDGT